MRMGNIFINDSLGGDVPSRMYHNDMIMAFFYELLCFLGKIRKVANRARNRHISLSMGEEKYSVTIGVAGTVDYLIWIFHMFYNERATYDEIRIETDNVQDAKDIWESYSKNRKILAFKIDNCRDYAPDKNKIDGIVETLGTTFIDETIKDYLKNAYDDLKQSYSFSSANCLWKRYEISKFLNIYYKILRCFLCEDELLESEGFVEKILIPTLNLGVEKSKEGEEYRAGMSMPVVLYAINLIYDKLEEFLLLADDLDDILYNEIFLAKIHQMFRFYLVQESNGEIYHAALPAYKERLEQSVMVVPVRAISTYNSYQGIRELRLADKILFELNQGVDARGGEAENNFTYQIVIFGDVVERAIEALLYYTRKQILIKKEYSHLRNIGIKIDAYTLRIGEGQNNFNREINSRYYYEFHQYNNELLNILKLKAILDEGELFFFLDHRDLYRSMIENIDDLILFRQYVSLEDYDVCGEQYLPDDLVLNGKFMNLYHVLTMYAWKNKMGFLRKKAKGELVKYIREVVESQNGKSAYIYISDIAAFKELKCVQENIVRIETYNQKEIGIIRFTSFPREQLPLFFCPENVERNSRHQMLVFNMWQLIKHIVLNEKANFEYRFIKNREKNMLDQIYIALDYSEWGDTVWMSYWYENKKAFKREEIEKFINDILKKIFNNGKKNMYQKYLKKVLISILYGAAKSVEDLLFVYILKDREDLLGQFRWWYPERGESTNRNDGGYNPIIKTYYSLSCKFSLKKNYWEIMRKYDKSSLNLLDQYTVLESIKKSNGIDGAPLQDETVVRFFKDIVQVCETMNYEESSLYSNCRKIEDGYF